MKKKQSYPHNFFEDKAWDKRAYVCGIDEAGRGALAGPVVAAAAILPLGTQEDFLQDSKVMSKQQREKAYEWITKHCIYASGIVSHEVIDTINIYQATLRAMQQACCQVFETIPDAQQIHYVLIDAMPLHVPEAYRHENLERVYFNYGESISSSIAAASIVAKVTRDRIMDNMAKIFPAFNFDVDKGYGTKSHCVLLEKHDASLIHRKTFLTKIQQKTDVKKFQQTLF